MGDSSQKIKQMEAQKEELNNKADVLGREAAEIIREERRQVMTIDSAFDAQKRFIWKVKLIVTAIMIVIVILLWDTGHYVFSVAFGIFTGIFLVAYGMSFREFNSGSRKNLQQKVEDRLN